MSPQKLLRPDRGFRWIEHTADVAFRAWAPSEEALFVESAKALVSLLTEGAAIVPNSDHVIDVRGVDPEDRLIRWLNELLFLAIGQGFLFADAQRLVLSRGGDASYLASASVIGERDAYRRIVTEAKSVTYHGACITKRNGVWRVALVVDV